MAVADEGIKFGRVLHPGAETLGYAKQEYVWLSGASLAHSSQLERILDMWGLERPNLLINLVTSWCHPKTFIHSKSLTQPDLANVVQKARDAIQLQQDTFASADGRAIGAAGEDGKDSLLLEMLSESLFNRLVGVMAALLDACASTNSWLLCDNYTSVGTLTYILESALSKTESRPTILCVADSKAGMFNKEDVMKQCWALLASDACLLKDDDDLEKIALTRLPSNLYGGGTNLEENWLRPVIDGGYPPQDAIEQPLGKWPFRCASHYMFSECGENELLGTASGWSLPFPVSWLGTMGLVVTGGSSGYAQAADHILFRSITSGLPTIILKNTGVASDFWGHLVDIVLKDQCTTEDTVIRRLNERYPFWYASSDPETLYGGDKLNKNMYPFVNSLLSVQWAQLRNSTVVIDAFTENPESVLKRLSACFAASSDNAVELGAGSAADKVVENVWHQYEILKHNCHSFAALSNRMTLGGLLLAFFSTVFAVFLTYVKGHKDQSWTDLVVQHEHEAKMMIMVIPALAGLLVTLLSRLRYVSKWGGVYLAAEQTKSEIYKYRAHAAEYDARAVPKLVSTDKKSKKAGQKSAKAAQAQEIKVRSRPEIRKCFVERTSAIFRDVMTTEINNDALSDPGDLEACRLRWQDKKKPSAPRVCCGLIASRPALVVKEYEAMDDEEDINDDDLISSLSCEEYFEHRTLPKLAHYRALAPRLSRRLTCYEVLIVLTSLGSTLLGALELTDWIPIAVAFGAVLGSLLSYEALQQRVASANAAVQDLTDAQVRWSSYGVVEKRTPSVKALMVEVTETAIMRDAAAFTANTGHVGGRGAKDGGGASKEGKGEKAE